MKKVFVVLCLFFAAVVFNNVSYAQIYNSISGRVIDAETGEPVEGADIKCVNQGLRWVIVKTNKKGLYKIRHLAAGTYSFMVDGPVGSYYTDSDQWINADLTKGKDVTNLNYQLYKGGAVSGFVFQADGITPAAGVRVRIGHVESNPSYLSTPKYAITDDQGYYFLKPVPVSDNAEVIVSYDNKPSITRNVAVAKEQVTENVNFNLIWDESTGIRGRVVDVNGNTVSGCSIRLDLPDFYKENYSKQIEATETDENGNFEILGLKTGTYYIYFCSDINDKRMYSEVNLLVENGNVSEVVATLDKEFTWGS